MTPWFEAPDVRRLMANDRTVTATVAEEIAREMAAERALSEGTLEQAVTGAIREIEDHRRIIRAMHRGIPLSLSN